MLAGSTFAWFTDTATTGANQIKSGMLDVGLEMKVTENGKEKWVDAEGVTLTFKTADNRSADEIFWEPGCTYELPELRVVNNGNLALKYKVEITGIKGDAKLNEVINWTIVEGVEGTDSNAILDEDGKATGEYFLLPAGATTAPLTIKGEMDKNAGNEYQNLTIDGIGITVYATQYTYEAFVYFTQVFDHAKAYEARKTLLTSDSSKKYDYEQNETLNIWYTSYIYKLTVKLDCDIDLKNMNVDPFLFEDIVSTNSAFTFDGNGHIIKNAKLASSTGNVGFFGPGVSVKHVTLDNIHVTATGNSEDQCAGIVSSNVAADISNVTVKNSSVVGGKYTGAVVGYSYGSVTDCTVESCTVSGQYKVGGIVGYICNNGNNDPKSVTGNKLTNVTVKGENIWAGKENFVLGKIVGNWNATTGTCKNNNFSGTPNEAQNIGKVESRCEAGLIQD